MSATQLDQAGSDRPLSGGARLPRALWKTSGVLGGLALISERRTPNV